MTHTFENNKKTDIPCPDCGPSFKLVVKTNRENGNQFLGCVNYPVCSYTRGIPEEWKLRAAGQQGLFDGLEAVNNVH